MSLLCCFADVVVSIFIVVVDDDDTASSSGEIGEGEEDFVRGVFVDVGVEKGQQENDVVRLGGEERVEEVEVVRLPVSVDERFRLLDVVLETGSHVGRVPHD